jgi:hypothetical protein
MKIFDLLMERRSDRIVYHGTSSVFLRSILKHGLQANPPNRSFGNKEWHRESFPGVYLSASSYIARWAADAAADIHGGHPMMLRIIYRQGSGKVDEDSITDFLKSRVSFDLRKYVKDTEKTIDNVVKDTENLALRGVAFTNRSRALLRNLIRHTFEYAKQNPLEFFTGRGEYIDSPEYRQDLQKFIDSTKVFTPNDPNWDPENQSFKRDDLDKIWDHYNDMTLRITKDIGFKGHTRIISIYNPRTNQVYYKER